MADIIAIYDDDLVKLFEGMSMKIKRASHVEPIEIDGMVTWQADMGPVGGPILSPFNTRQEALAAEHKWLEANILASNKDPFQPNNS